MTPICGSLSRTGLTFSPEPHRVTCQRCRQSASWRDFYDRDQSLRKRTA